MPLTSLRMSVHVCACACVYVLKERSVPKLHREAAASGVERVEGLEVLQQKCNYSLVLIGRGV